MSAFLTHPVPTHVAALVAALVVCAAGGVRASADNKAVRAADLMPLYPRAARFLATESDSDEALHVRVRFYGDERHWRLRQDRDKTRILERRDDGTILYHSNRIDTRDSMIAFSPAVPMLPATLAAGRPYRYEMSVRVTDPKTGRAKATGDGTREIELLGRRVTSTPAGDFDTVIVRTTDRYDFGFAVVELVTTSAYRPGVGLIRQHTRRTVRKLGVFGDTSDRTLVLDKPWSIESRD